MQEKRISGIVSPMDGFVHISPFAIIVALLWVLPWKAYALWTCAKRSDKRWFIALVVLNTFAILDIFYLFYVAKKTPADIKDLIKRKL